MFGVKRFHQFVYGRPFVIYTDHKLLLTLFGEEKGVPTCSGRLQRWSSLLSGYQYELKYRPGKENTNADALSRLPIENEEALEGTPSAGMHLEGN